MSDVKAVAVCTEGVKHTTQDKVVRGDSITTPKPIRYNVCGKNGATPEEAEKNLTEVLEKETLLVEKNGGGEDYFTSSSSRRFQVCSKVSWFVSGRREKLEGLGEIWTERFDSKKICAIGDSYLPTDQSQEKAVTEFVEKYCEHYFEEPRFAKTAKEACESKERKREQDAFAFMEEMGKADRRGPKW